MDPSGDLVKACMRELKEYFAGQRQKFDLPLSPEGTNSSRFLTERPEATSSWLK
ncbi:hypothetical protein [Lactobacillus delbrueckii]|uniref:hypothetical protein n=1 Tax=Lactobacillus delbrueckii TaxID=1584 RepID=UPI003F5720D6